MSDQIPPPLPPHLQAVPTSPQVPPPPKIPPVTTFKIGGAAIGVTDVPVSAATLEKHAVADEMLKARREAAGKTQELAAKAIEDAMDALTDVLAEDDLKAVNARVRAAEILLERAAGAAINFTRLGCSIEGLNTGQAMDKVISQASEGVISLQDAEALVRMLKAKADTVDTVDIAVLAERLGQLEKTLAQKTPLRVV